MDPNTVPTALPFNVSMQPYIDPQLETLGCFSFSLLPSMNDPYLSSLEVVDFASVHENMLIQQLLKLAPMPYIDLSLEYQGESATPASNLSQACELQSSAQLPAGLVPPPSAVHTVQWTAENLREAAQSPADSGTGVPEGGCDVPGSEDMTQAADTWFPVHSFGIASPKSEMGSSDGSPSRSATTASKAKPAKQKKKRVRVYTVRSHSCTLCESSFFRKQDLDRHGAVHGLGVSLACSRGCGRVFARRDALGRHLKSVKCLEKMD